MEASIQAVTLLVCWRGLEASVPVAALKTERFSGMTCVRLALGSNCGSPLGTGMLKAVAGSAGSVRSRS